MDAETVVASLFAHHLGLAGGAVGITNFRDLFSVRALAAHAQKVRLLAAAERTGCAAVVMDVLLFVSQTMAHGAFHRELACAPVCRQHWIQYELAQQQRDAPATDDARRVAVEARVAGILSTLLATKTPPLDIALVLLQLVFQEQHGLSLVATQAVAKEVLRVATRTKPYRLPQWAIDLLREFVELSDLQLETERLDAFRAPPASVLSAYFDKRARGANNVNANWRMRSFQLDEKTLSYSKHDAEKLAASKNPFLDKRIKGSVALSKQLPVEPLNYAGKVSRRPYCIKIGSGDDALIMDACTPVVQAQWMSAIAGNVRRLELDPRWLRFPRPNVIGMSLHAFLRYALLYHSDSNSSTVQCDAQQLTTQFTINEKRVLFASLLSLAQRGKWAQFEALALTESKPKLFSKATAVDPRTAIGYGAVLDIATAYHAPLGLLSTLEALYDKNDAKKPVWTCHTRANTATDSVAIDVDALRMRDARDTSSSSLSSSAAAY